MKKIIIFDKDNTLILPTSGETFVQSPTDQSPNVDRQWIANLSKSHRLFIASNQGGITAKHKTMDAAIAEMQYCLGLFPEIAYAVFCPDFEGAVCVQVFRDGSSKMHNGQNFRKPDGGMIDLICQLENVEKSGAVFVGDRPEDANAAKTAGIEFMDINDFLEGGYREIHP